MIKISGSIIEPKIILEQYPEDSVQRKIVEILSMSSETYLYRTLEQLKFEIDLRMNIIKASRELNDSDFSFKVFRKSICNSDYWERTDEGGFLLKKEVKPSEAIKDIYKNSSKYGTECATAIVILYYKAVADIYPQELFDKMFSSIYLMDWQHIDNDLRVDYYANEKDYLPGDCRYFKNPDVNPVTPEWQGENAIDLGDGTYYGHGVGIRKADGVVAALNKRRKDRATKEAYLIDSATRPDFRYLADKNHE